MHTPPTARTGGQPLYTGLAATASMRDRQRKTTTIRSKRVSCCLFLPFSCLLAKLAGLFFCRHDIAMNTPRHEGSDGCTHTHTHTHTHTNPSAAKRIGWLVGWLAGGRNTTAKGIYPSGASPSAAPFACCALHWSSAPPSVTSNGQCTGACLLHISCWWCARFALCPERPPVTP
jgi:hypothetical protein